MASSPIKSVISRPTQLLFFFQTQRGAVGGNTRKPGARPIRLCCTVRNPEGNVNGLPSTPNGSKKIQATTPPPPIWDTYNCCTCSKGPAQTNNPTDQYPRQRGCWVAQRPCPCALLMLISLKKHISFAVAPLNYVNLKTIPHQYIV